MSSPYVIMSSDYVLAIHDECVLQVAGKKGKTNRRGLAAWVKDEGFCSVWIQDAADFYTQTIGRVPVVSGVEGQGQVHKRLHPWTTLSRQGYRILFIRLHDSLCGGHGCVLLSCCQAASGRRHRRSKLCAGCYATG